MFRYNHVVSFWEKDIGVKESIPCTPDPRDLAQFYLLRECCKKSNVRRHGVPILYKLNDEPIKEILNPKPLSLFEEFRNDFYYEKYSKQAKLGESKDCKTKPPHVNNGSTTFGDKSVSDAPLYGIILPEKKPEEVIREYYENHEQSIKSHNHYFPGEQIRRHYQPPFDKDNCFGESTKVADNGELVARAITTCNTRYFLRERHMNFLQAHQAFLGKTFKRGLPTLPPDQANGISTNDRDLCDMKCILEDTERADPAIGAEKNVNLDAIFYIRNLRYSLINSPHRRLYDLLLILTRKDEKGSGSLTVGEIFEAISEEYKLRINENKFRAALKYYNVIEGEITNESVCPIEKFWKFLHLNFELPKGKSLAGTPGLLIKTSSYSEAFGKVASDRYIKPERVKAPKGPSPLARLISPDILIIFDLEEEDYSELLTKDKLRRIFRSVIKESEDFDKIWEAAKIRFERNEDLVSVTDIRSVIKEFDFQSIEPTEPEADS